MPKRKIPYNQICEECGEEKPLSEFYGNGYVKTCKVCKIAYSCKYQKEGKGYDVHRKASSKYKQTDKGKESARRSTAKQREKRSYKRREQAYKAVQKALYNLELRPLWDVLCEDCGDQAEVYHHESYRKGRWLDVTPLCRLCHAARHK